MPSTRRKITSAEEAMRLLDELEASNESAPAFYRRKGLDGRSLHCWRLNLEREPPAGKRPSGKLRVVEVPWPPVRGAVASRCGPPQDAAAPDVARYRVSVGDVVVEVDDAFQEDTLARLLDVVRAC